MGRTLALGLNRVHAPFKFFLYNPTSEKAEKLADEIQGTAVTALDQLAYIDVILIACRPQQFNQLAFELRPVLKGDELIVSIMAAIPTETLAQKLGVSKIVRMMPNTPNKIGLGVNLFYFSPTVSLPERTHLLNSFALFSSVFTLEKEDYLDICTAFTGCGPALVFEWARLMMEIMIRQGINPNDAHKMVAKTFLGASTLLMSEGKSPLELRQEVASKGGVTVEALKVFSDSKMEQIIEKATHQAYLRGKELQENL